MIEKFKSADVTATFEENEGEILLTFSEELFVFDDIYVLPIALAEKLKAQLDAALREAKGPHGKLFRKRKASGTPTKAETPEPTEDDAGEDSEIIKSDV